MRTLHEDRYMYIYDHISLRYSCNKKKIFQIKFVEKIKTHLLCSVTFFPQNRAVCEIMWKYMLMPDRPQMTIWRMRFARWTPKATNTYSE